MKYFIIAFVLLQVKFVNSQLLFQDNFENYPTGAINNDLRFDNSTGYGWWQIQNSFTSKLIFSGSGCPNITPDQHKIVSSAAYQGTKCARVFYNTNELWSGNNNPSGCRWRAEFAQRMGLKGLPTSGRVEVWYGFMIKPMKTGGMEWTKRCMGVTGNDVNCVGLRDNLETHISQFIADETGSMGITVDIKHDLLDQTNPRYFDITNIGRTEDVKWDQWNAVVMHVITGTNGVVEAMVNGVFYTSNPIDLWTATWTHDFKLGIYGDRINGQAEAFFDNMKFANGPNQFAAVNPVLNSDPLSAIIWPTNNNSPATISNFTVNNNNCVANLNWNTTAEIGGSKFEVEHKLNNGTFTKIGTLPCRGINGNGANYSYNYSLLDPGTHYFRLKIININYATNYSVTKATNCNGKLNVNVVNNSLTTTFSLINMAEGKNNICILNYLGRVLHTKIINNTFGELNINKLPKGLYIVKIVNENSVNIKKIIVL